MGDVRPSGRAHAQTAGTDTMPALLVDVLELSVLRLAEALIVAHQQTWL